MQIVRRWLMAGALLTGALACTIRPQSAAGSAVTWDDVVTWIYSYGAAYGVSGAWLERVAWCESVGNPYAIGRLGEWGPFQFHPFGVWWSTPLGQAGIGVYQASVEQQVDMAAWSFAHGLSFHWSCA